MIAFYSEMVWYFYRCYSTMYNVPIHLRWISYNVDVVRVDLRECVSWDIIVNIRTFFQASPNIDGLGMKYSIYTTTVMCLHWSVVFGPTFEPPSVY